MIEIINLSKKFSGTTVLENIDLTVRRGEVFGILGPNGAGKTTLMKIIATLIKPTEGKIKIFGLDIFKDKYKIKKIIGMASHEDLVYRELTARENLAFYATLYDIKIKIEDLLKKVGLEGKEDIPVKNFSYGMRRKLNIARALINNPQVLLLDEALSGLDIESKKRVYKMIENLKSSKTTIFLSTHEIEEIKICDRAAVINRKLLKVGEVDEILEYYEKRFKT